MAKVAPWPNAKRDGIGAGLVDLDGAKQHCSDDCDADRAADALHSADDAADCEWYCDKAGLESTEPRPACQSSAIVKNILVNAARYTKASRTPPVNKPWPKSRGGTAGLPPFRSTRSLAILLNPQHHGVADPARQQIVTFVRTLVVATYAASGLWVGARDYLRRAHGFVDNAAGPPRTRIWPFLLD